MINDYLANATRNGDGTLEQVVAAEASLGIRLPRDLRVFLTKHAGVEGFVRDGGFVRFWAASTLLEHNEGYSVAEFLPRIVLFGSNGGGEGFGLNYRRDPPTYIRVPLASINENDIEELGGSLLELFQHLVA